MEKPSAEELRALEERIAKLVEDPAWQERLRRSLEEAAEASEAFRKAGQYRSEDLDNPFTI